MSLKLADESTLETLEEVTDALNAFNHANSDVGNAHQKVFVLRNEEGQLGGGIVFVVHWHWLYIEILFVHEAFRHQGLGGQLLLEAETYAKKTGCVGAYLDTLSFQAPDFYLKHGYEVLAELEGFPPGRNRKVYFSKTVLGRRCQSVKKNVKIGELVAKSSPMNFK